MEMPQKAKPGMARRARSKSAKPPHGPRVSQVIRYVGIAERHGQGSGACSSC